MKILNVDMELLLELSAQETRGDGESYLNLTNGEFAYIPRNVIKAMENQENFEELESWERKLADEAEDIIMNYDSNYLYVPLVSENIIIDIMKKFINTIKDSELATKLYKAIDWNSVYTSFNKEMIKNDKIDEFYDFQDKELKKYLIQWLESHEIKVLDNM